MLRSEFLRTTAVAGLGALCGAACVSPLAITGCSSGKYVDGIQSNGEISIPLSAFARRSALIIRKNDSMQGPIHVVRSEGNAYTALSLLCTHKGCVVRPVGNSFECPCHGSEFNADGTVLSSPAQEPLMRYDVTTDATHLHIKL